MKKLLIVLALGLVLLTGCATQNPGLQVWQQQQEARAARLDAVASSCETDLCRVMIAQEQGKTPPPPQRQYHPAWQLLDRTLSIALPMYGSYMQGQQWADAMVGVVKTVGSMDGSYTDNSVNIGRDQIGGDRTVDSSNHSINAGGNLAGGDQIGGDSVGGDQWHGDRYSDSCIGDDCRSASPGPWDIDESDNSTTDNSDNSDNSTQPEPVDLSSE